MSLFEQYKMERDRQQKVHDMKGMIVLLISQNSIFFSFFNLKLYTLVLFLQLAEEEEIRRLRKELVPKAQPMPYFDRPFIPRRYR